MWLESFSSDQMEVVQKGTILRCVVTELEFFITTWITEIYFKTVIWKTNSGHVVVVHAFGSSTWEAEACRSLWVQGHPSLQGEFQNTQSCHSEKPFLKQKPINKYVQKLNCFISLFKKKFQK